MPANPWELRADVRPLEAAAERWTEVGALVSRHGDVLVDAARRATEGWDAASAESYDEHRKRALAYLDRFAAVADLVADCLRAAAERVTSSQIELDRAWTTLAAVPHELVGESRHLVFTPSEDAERGKVTRGQAEADEIRARLTVALDRESARLRSARAEMVTVRTELMSLTGGSVAGLPGEGGEASGVGSVARPSGAVPGSVQAGVAALPPLAPVAVSVPDLTGPSAAGLPSLAASAADWLHSRGRASARLPAAGTPPIDEMAAGGMAAHAGTMSPGMASGRSGAARVAPPRLQTTAAAESAARAAREEEAVRDAQRSRSARRRPRRDDEHDDEPLGQGDPDPGAGTDADGDTQPDSGERRNGVRVVHEATPASPVGERRR